MGGGSGHDADQGVSALLKVVLGALLAVLFTVPATAQDTGASCSQIAEDARRLACYDRLFRTDGPVAVAETVTIQSERPIPAQPSGREPAEMIVACEEGVLTVRFRIAGQIVSATSDIAPFTFQVDQSGTTVESLRAAPDNRSAGFWTTEASEGFLDSLAGGRNLKVRMTPPRVRSLTLDFRLEGHFDAIAALRESCTEAQAR